jgi:hypothetical protein
MAPPPAPAPKVVEKTTAPGGSATTLANVAAGSAPGSASAASADAERPAARAHSRRTGKAGRGHGMRGSALLEKIDGKGAKAKPAKPAGRARADDDFIDSLLKK